MTLAYSTTGRLLGQLATHEPARGLATYAGAPPAGTYRILTRTGYVCVPAADVVIESVR